MRLDGNTILITGGGTGIGLALAERLAENNRVIICGRRAHVLEAAKARTPSLVTRVADVSDTAQREALVSWAIAEHPALNVLVNNAGVQQTFDLLAATRDMSKAREEVETNLIAPLDLAARLIDHLRAQPSAAIINITSGLAFAPLAHMPVYCATKAALHSLTMSLRHQTRDTSVRVFEVAPPIVATELGASHRPPQMNATAMTAETAAEGIIDALANDRYEAALGDAENLRAKREALFDVMNRR